MLYSILKGFARLTKELLIEIWNVIKFKIIARGVYFIMWASFTISIKGKFVVTTEPMKDNTNAYNNKGAKIYPAGTVFYVQSMNSFKACTSGNCLLKIIDPKTKELVQLDLIPRENCKILPYSELSKVLYGFDDEE